MTIITKDLLKTLRSELDAAVLSVAKKHGLIIKTGNASFDASSATFKLAIVAPADGDTGVGAVEAKAAHDFTNYAKRFDLDPSLLGKTFNYKGGVTKIIGLLPNRPTYPVLCSTATRKPFLLTAGLVKELTK